MASYNDNMPDGLTYTEEQKQAVVQSSSVEVMKKLLELTNAFGTKDESLKEELQETLQEQQKLFEKLTEEQEQRKLDAALLKEKGASDEEIVAYLSRRQEIYEKDTKEFYDSFSSIKRKFDSWVEEDLDFTAEERLQYRKQLESFEKSYNLEEQLLSLNKENQENNDSLLSRIAENTKGTWKEALENGKSERKSAFSSLASSLLGPIKLISDPLLELTSGKSTKEFIESFYEKWTTKKEEDQEAERLKRDAELEAALSQTQKPLVSSVDTIAKYVTKNATEEPPKNESESLEDALPSNDDIFSMLKNPEALSPELDKEEDPAEQLLEETAPEERDLLRKGGVIGATAVFIGKQIRNLGKDIDELAKEKGEEGEDEGGLFGKGTKTLKKVLKQYAPTLASAAGVLAVAAVPAVMLATGLNLQKRDTKDAKKYADEGKTGRAVETALLGDRNRLTEENANSELGRATAKNALIVGGAAGGTALVAGGAAAGISAGAAAAAGGAGLMGTGLTAAGATAGAVFPPLLIAGAIAAAATVVAKGTQEAFELGWDKNQAEIQKNLYDTIYSKDSSVWEKVKASVSSTWKGVTGTLAGGIRGVTEELAGNAAIEWERGLDYLAKTAEEGNKENARLLTLLQSEEFKQLSKKDQEMILEAEGLMDEYNSMLEQAKGTMGERLLNSIRATGAFFTQGFNTFLEGQKGKAGAKLDAKILEDMKNITGEDVERLKNSVEYAEAIAQGKNQKQAMEAAYLAERHRENEALGIQREDGAMTGISDYAMTYFGRKTDEDYRQTHEYSQKKALLLEQGYTAEEADLKAIEDYNNLYDKALELRLKQTKDYRDYYKKCLEEGKSIEESEQLALEEAEKNKENMLTINELAKLKLDAFKNTISSAWTATTDWMGKVGGWIADKTGGFFSGIGTGISNWWNSQSDAAQSWLAENGGYPTQINDGIVTKDGKVIQLSPDDNVYATKNMPTVVGDADAQRAMPAIPAEHAEFTDVGIIGAIQELIEVVKNKNMSPEINVEGDSSVNVGDFRTA